MEKPLGISSLLGNEYTPDNPPRRGNGRKIWRALERAGYRMRELHYNPGGGGANFATGIQMWGAGCFDDNGHYIELLCAADDGGVLVGAPGSVNVVRIPHA